MYLAYCEDCGKVFDCKERMKYHQNEACTGEPIGEAPIDR